MDIAQIVEHVVATIETAFCKNTKYSGYWSTKVYKQEISDENIKAPFSCINLYIS